MAADEDSTKNSESVKPLRGEEVLGWLVLLMLHHSGVLDISMELRKRIDSDIARHTTAKLEQWGCSREQIILTLALASGLEKNFYPPINAAELRAVATRIKILIREMERLVPPVTIPFATINDDGTAVTRWEPAAGDLQLQPSLKNALIDKITMYEELAEMCRTKEVPDRATMRRLAHLLPLIYVDAKTGAPHYAEVARLMWSAGIDKITPNGLGAAYASVREKEPRALMWLRAALTRVLALAEETDKSIFIAYVVPEGGPQKDLTEEKSNEHESNGTDQSIERQ